MCGCACATDVRPRAWSRSSAMAEPEVSLDKALERLEAIADKLEDPALDLDEAVRIYEEGLRLYAECAKRLAGDHQHGATDGGDPCGDRRRRGWVSAARP